MSRLRPSALVLVLLLGLPLGACGRKGPPRPPQFVIPRSPEPLVVEENPKGVRITWKRPREYVDGSPLDDLDVPRDRPCRYRVFAVTADGYRSDAAESPSILLGKSATPH